MEKICRTDEREEEEAIFQCADFILPWLHATELASISSTGKTLKAVAKSLSARRISDACRTFENLPIPFVNTVDDQPYAFFIYIPTQIVGSGSNCTRQPWGSNPVTRSVTSRDSIWAAAVVEDACGCDGDSDCPCKEMNVPELSRECGPSCRCGLVCGNRLTQRGISVRLKIVKDKKKGWGLRSDQFIQKGDLEVNF